MCLHSGLYCHLNLFLSGLMIGSQNMFMIVRLNNFAYVAGTNLLTANDKRNLYNGFALSFKFRIYCNALRTACKITFYRFVSRQRKAEN